MKEVVKNISQIQFEYFDDYIPAEVKSIWLQGLQSDEYYLKLCGSGGGGYLILWSEFNMENIKQRILKFPISEVSYL